LQAQNLKNVMNRIKQIFTSFFEGLIALFFPNLCVGCAKESVLRSQHFCIPCQIKTKKTQMHLSTENEFTQRLGSKLPFKTGAAMYHFQKGTPIQKAIHQLKYKNNPKGREYGIELLKSAEFKDIDIIIPIPLHPKRERERGYNQSTKFAIGLSESMGIPYQADGLERAVHAISQTKKKRTQRFDKVDTYFKVKDPQFLAGKRVLLVDDVLTTGATLESCGHLLAEVPNVTLYMATIAMAVRK
jgi:ComF family protein